MLINGVEISNYKSSDKMYFGPLNKVEVLNGGDNFDVINLPSITISSGIGSTALVQPVISGKIADIFVDEQNFVLDKIQKLLKPIDKDTNEISNFSSIRSISYILFHNWK